MMKGALIGAGKIAHNGHLPAYAQPSVASRARIVAVMDPSAESRRLAQEKYPDLRFYDSADRLFREEEIDFIDVCAPPSCHAEVLEMGAGRGLHMLCEKPLSVTLQDAERIAGILKCRQELVFMPCHQYRYSPVWMPFKSFADAAGEKAGMFAQFNVYRTQADPGFPSWNAAWRTDRSISGGGILADTGVHYLYLTLWMFGSPTAVTANVQRLRFDAGAVEDTAVVLLEFPRGLAQLNLTWGADRRANSARIVGGSGSVVYDGETLLRYDGDRRTSLPVPDASDKSHYVSLYVSLVTEFLDRIEMKKGSGGWIDEACLSIQLLRACYRSAEEKRTIALGTTS